jgi:hypothetical protein
MTGARGRWSCAGCPCSLPWTTASSPPERAPPRHRAEVARLGLAGVRLTGTVPMADEEFASVAEGAVENTILSFVLVGILLWMALRSFRLIWPLLVLVVVGLLWTAGFGILAVGSFNPLSIAFAVLFIGIGVDFGIQYAVQYRAENAALQAAGAENAAPRAPGAERGAAGGLLPALEAAARTAGPGMTLAAWRSPAASSPSCRPTIAASASWG